jgi:hypothetical protein
MEAMSLIDFMSNEACKRFSQLSDRIQELHETAAYQRAVYLAEVNQLDRLCDLSYMEAYAQELEQFLLTGKFNWPNN